MLYYKRGEFHRHHHNRDNDFGDDDDDDKCHNYSEGGRELQQEMSFKIYFAD